VVNPYETKVREVEIKGKRRKEFRLYVPPSISRTTFGGLVKNPFLCLSNGKQSVGVLNWIFGLSVAEIWGLEYILVMAHQKVKK
jgi:hypothetical protein